MSKFSFGRTHWRNPDSKYAYAPTDQLDKDIQANIERYKRKKKHIKALVEGTIASDPVRQEETLEMFIGALREWRERNEKIHHQNR